MAAFTFTVGRKKHSASNVVLTGAMMAPRKKLVAALKRAGAHVQGSVSKSTELLIVGHRPGAAKLDKAADLGVPYVESDVIAKFLGDGFNAKSGGDALDRAERDFAAADRKKWSDRTRELKRTHRKAQPGERADFTYQGHGWVKKHTVLIPGQGRRKPKPRAKPTRKRTSKKPAKKPTRKTSRKKAPARKKRTSKKRTSKLKKFFWEDSEGRYGMVSASSSADAKKRVVARGKRGVKIKTRAPSWY